MVLFPRGSGSAAVSARDPRISVLPAEPTEFQPPPRHLLGPPSAGDANDGPNDQEGNNVTVGETELVKDTGWEAKVLPAISPFTTEDSPSRRRINRHILGHLASPSMSDTPICSPARDMPPSNLGTTDRQSHNHLDVFYPYRNAQSQNLVTTASHSPHAHMQPVVAASLPTSSSTSGSLLGRILAGDSVGTGTPNRLVEHDGAYISNDESGPPPRGAKRRRRKFAENRSLPRSSVVAPRRVIKRPRPHSLDPAGRDIPMRGKKIVTYALAMVSVFLLFQSLIAGEGFAPMSVNPMLGPSAETLLDMGGLVTHLVREGEWWRLIWSPFLHAGLFHLVLNIALWVPLGSLAEPDWGAIRTATIFMSGAFTGNLMSACLDPYTVSVGSSGGIFGVMAAFVPYVIEFWHSIPRAKCLLGLVGVTLVVGVATSFIPFVDVYAHIGGVIGGILAGFATISKWQAFTEVKPRDKYRWPHLRSNSKRLSVSLSREMTRDLTKSNDNDRSARSCVAASQDAKEDEPALAPKTAPSSHLNSSLASGAEYEENKPPKYKITSVSGNSSQLDGWLKVDGVSEGANDVRDKCILLGEGTAGGDVELRDAELGIANGSRRGSTGSKRSVTLEDVGNAQPVNARERPIDRGRKRSFRTTLDPVNDHYGCTAKIWGVRIASAILLVCVWVPLFYYLFVCPECYEAPGQLVTIGSSGSSGKRSLVPQAAVSATKGKLGRLMGAIGKRSSTTQRLSYRYYEQQLRRQLLLLKEFM